MKNSSKHCFSDEISGKESEDYIGEFAPYRLTVIQFDEDSEFILGSDEKKTTVSP